MCNKLLAGVKIARISTVAFFVETQLRSQLEMMVSQGASVYVVASDSQLLNPIQGTNYVSIQIPRKLHILKDLVALYKLWVLFRSEKFDIVHSTTPKAGLLCSLAGRLAGVKVRLHTFTGQPWFGSSCVSARLAKWADWIIFRLNTHCYADSFSQCDFLYESKIVNKNGITVIGDGSIAGVDLSRFRSDRFCTANLQDIRTSIGVDSGSFLIIFVGRCTRDKGILELFSAFEQILRWELRASLVMVGPFEQDARGIIDSLPSWLSEKIVFTGFTDCPEQYMAIADILVIPSYREGFGTVVIEAAAMGLPSVGSNIYGLRDAIVDGQTGILVPPKNVEDLAFAIATLYREPKRLTQLGNNARDRAQLLFSSDRVNSLVVDEYAHLLDRGEYRRVV